MRRLWILIALAAAAILAAPGTVWGRTGHHHRRATHHARKRHSAHKRHSHKRHRRRHKHKRTTATTATIIHPGGTVTSGSGSKVGHVVWIWMENHGYNDVIGSSSAPYINGLASTYGLATNYFANDHPSLPNYLEATTGDPNVGGYDDSDNPSNDATSDPSIFSQLPGGQSRSLMEGMPSNCASGASGEYVGHHNPMMFFTNLGTDCQNYDVPLNDASPDISAKFTFISPNLIDDMHDGTVQDGDNFLKSFIPTLMNTSQYKAGNTAIFIVWDEDGSQDGLDQENNQVPMIVISPFTHGVQDGTSYDHYSLLRTTEELLGLPLLGSAASANSMVTAFGL